MDEWRTIICHREKARNANVGSGNDYHAFGPFSPLSRYHTPQNHRVIQALRSDFPVKLYCGVVCSIALFPRVSRPKALFGGPVGVYNLLDRENYMHSSERAGSPLHDDGRLCWSVTRCLDCTSFVNQTELLVALEASYAVENHRARPTGGTEAPLNPLPARSRSSEHRRMSMGRYRTVVLAQIPPGSPWPQPKEPSFPLPDHLPQIRSSSSECHVREARPCPVRPSYI